MRFATEDGRVFEFRGEYATPKQINENMHYLSPTHADVVQADRDGTKDFPYLAVMHLLYTTSTHLYSPN